MFILIKILGLILTVCGGGGSLLFMLLGADKILEVVRWGWMRSDAVYLIICVICLIISLLILVFGIKLLRKPKREEGISFFESEREKEKGRLSFAESEREKERKSHPSMDIERREDRIHVMPGTTIWKYQGGESGSGLFLRYRHRYLFGTILGVMVVIVILSVLLIDNSQQLNRWILTAGVLVLAGVVIAVALWIGQTSQGMMFTFARDEDGSMYLFDYQSPVFQKYSKLELGGKLSILTYIFNNRQDARLIEEIDRGQLIERILGSGSVYPYGQQVAHVRKVQKKKRSCRIDCILVREDGSTYTRSISIPDAYHNYDELLRALKRLGRIY